ncbi:conserved hypothetical protein (DUF939) [Alteracholeplasma palmae J233]|uniref:Putative aromatic acid exporter C-terminal domain-containing protein n=1 Tax=Alteracholeplasma palmae (strain ATCC 49389 / J233) TaxID=1318466 RepID=U4KKA2_ALTPJ|nr:aromatic acid exporter family protein [Alteracholeplasma palmae]CCV63992.1 conserved hypothetical protein (DUF939) [Alteracholeplasma palmae J233]
MNRKIQLAIQMIIAGIITTLVAYFLSLNYWQTSGVISILSINMTRQDSLKVAFKRTVDVTIALLLSTLLFYLIGYNLYVYLGFLVIFIFGSWLLNLSEGIVVSIVLVIHILSRGEFDGSLLLNEFSIFILALIIALAVNILYPNVNEKKLEKNVVLIDQYIQEHTFMLSLLLNDLTGYKDYKKHYFNILNLIEPILKEADLLKKDQVLNKDFKYADYLYMRKAQLTSLNRMYDLTLKIKSEETITKEISEFIQQLCFDIGKDNKASFQLSKLAEYRKELEKTALPKTRNEFETRAVLYQILNELENFLFEKQQYHEKYEKKGQ